MLYKEFYEKLKLERELTTPSKEIADYFSKHDEELCVEVYDIRYDAFYKPIEFGLIYVGKKELYTNTHQNKPNQPIYVYRTETPNGTLGEHIGNFTMLSADMCRSYNIHSKGKSASVEFKNFCYYPVNIPEGYDDEYACREFVLSCEEIRTDGYTDVYCKEVAENIMDMSKELDYDWVMEETTDSDTHEECWRIYSADFAKKAYIGQDVIFCINEKSLVNAMKEESISSYCDFQKHDVIEMIGDGTYMEYEAYVIIRNKLSVRTYAKEAK